MNQEAVNTAAQTLWSAWRQGAQLDGLPEGCRPLSRQDGYAIQAAVQQRSGQGLFGWKIAATSAAGQRHIGVDGPLAGRLLSGRVRDEKAAVPLANSLMRVGEAEFAFRMARDLPLRDRAYTEEEVKAAVAALYPAIEIPDSRFREYRKLGAAHLIADNGCACYFVLGPEVRADWRKLDLAALKVVSFINGEVSREGEGANVLGGPWIAMTWLANELGCYAHGLKAGQVVTTGTCVVPFEINPGDKICADFGLLGKVQCSLST